MQGYGGNAWGDVCTLLEASPLGRLQVLVGNRSGTIWSYEKGDADPHTVYRLASASKWMVAVTILRLVERGLLRPEDRPQDHIAWWTREPGDPRSRIRLDQLLSLTSGLPGFRRGMLASGSLEASVRHIHAATDVRGEMPLGLRRRRPPEVEADSPSPAVEEPGTVFDYGGAHLQVAALMAVGAAGAPSWDNVFRTHLAEPLGMSDEAHARWHQAGQGGAADLVGLAGDYGRFLRALLAGELLGPALGTLERDRIVPGVSLRFSPPRVVLDQDWHYAAGHWLECREPVWTAAAREPVRSSPGALGFYPWMDRAAGYWAVLATERRGWVEAEGERPAAFGEQAVRLGQGLQPLLARLLGG